MTQKKTQIYYSFLVAFFLSIFVTVNAIERSPLARRSDVSLFYSENRIFFFSQPRSGTHWIFFILKHFTSRPLSDDTYYNDPFDQPIDFSLPFIHHCHVAYAYVDAFKKNILTFPPPNVSKDKALVIIRNPLDTLLRMSSSYEDAVEKIKNRCRLYLFPNLNYAETWPEENRYIFYYEDILDYPKEEITKLLDFLDVPNPDVDGFIDNIEEYRHRTITIYNRNNGPSDLRYSKTNGKDRLFYQRKYTKEELQNLIALLKEIDPEIWSRYLTRYEILD